MPLRRLVVLSAAVSGHLRRGLSTASSPSRPPWAMIRGPMVVNSPEPRALLHLPAPPCISQILVPAHLVDAPPRPDRDSDTVPVREVFGGLVSAVSADGVLLLEFMDLRLREAAPVFKHGYDQARAVDGVQIADLTRFVLNPLSGQMFRLPDIDGTKKTVSCVDIGILTQSERPDQPPDRYAVAVLNDYNDGGQQRFVMRRFLSQTGKWDELVALPSPSPHPMGRWMEVVAFAGRLWWVDISCGVISADPFSDRPDLHFVELPRGRVTEPVEHLDGFCRVGVTQGRLRYAEVSREEPFLVSSFTLDDSGSGWTTEHQVAFSRLWPGECHPYQGSPRIGVFDPLNASVLHLTIDNTVLAVDMVKKKLLRCSMISGNVRRRSSFLKACVLPPWLGSSQIPSAGTLLSKDSARSKTLSEFLVGVDKGKKK
ncbi:hypothetical protein BDA96_09G177300 [Sorghum bicolor]|uniref:DUF1618 domain-containing protein n=1 Tax=Sorghum bicolor TaxID=4558 RepID=A0A921U4H5_SORBI|nr:hypothetical protein BDA96_09G177300 [Sorghum bicolor]